MNRKRLSPMGRKTIYFLILNFLSLNQAAVSYYPPPKEGAVLDAVIKTPQLSSNRFQKAFDNLIKEEGGYVNDPDDPGGETKYGVSKRSYPHLNINKLTLNDVSKIYRKDFYDVLRCDELPTDRVAQEVLEQGVNMGVKTVISFLQIVAKSVGSPIDVDGKIGPKTLGALKRIPEDVLLAALKSLAIAHYLELAHERPPMRKYLNGWIRRVQT